MLGRAAGALSPLMVLDHFRGGAPELGAWQAAAGIGTVIGDGSERVGRVPGAGS